LILLLVLLMCHQK